MDEHDLPDKPLMDQLLTFLSKPTDIASLVLFRIAFGSLMAWEAWRYLSKGRVASHWLEPTVLFPYEAFPWVTPWPGAGMYIHIVVLGLLGLCIAAGFAYRLCCFLFFLGFSYIFLLDKTHYLNHFYLIILLSFLMTLVPAHRAFSVDALLRPGIRTAVVPFWPLWLLRAQLAIVYFYAALAKMNGDWLRGLPMRIWLAGKTEFPVLGGWFREDWAGYAFSYGGLLTDLLVVPALLWRPTRWIGIIVAFTFHLMNSQLFHIGVFPWLMIAATMLFLPPSWSRLGLFRLPDRNNIEGPPVVKRGLVVILAAYLLIQVLVPLRHFLYPGSTAWTEEGHRFSWRMMLRSKRSQARFIATDPSTGKESTIDALTYLTLPQAEEMSSRPDMILQFSHWIAEREQKQGKPAPAVRAIVIASLNGRKCQALIDPVVNLAAEPFSLGPYRWIVPLREPPPVGRSWRENRKSCGGMEETAQPAPE